MYGKKKSYPGLDVDARPVLLGLGLEELVAGLPPGSGGLLQVPGRVQDLLEGHRAQVEGRDLRAGVELEARVHGAGVLGGRGVRGGEPKVAAVTSSLVGAGRGHGRLGEDPGELLDLGTTAK